MTAWLLRSRWHLYGSLVLLLALLLFACRSGGGGEAAVESPEPTEAPDVVAPIDEETVTRLLEQSRITPGAAPTVDPLPTIAIESLPDEADPEAEAKARGFTTAWLASTTPGWPDTLAPWASSDLVEALRTTDPANVPPGSVLDVQPTVVGNTFAEFAVLIGENRTITVSVVLDAEGWVVVDVR